MHIALPIGNSSVLMGSDVPDILGQVSENESKEEAEHLFNELSAGGSVEMPLENSSWCTLFGACRDKYGIEWMIDFTAKQ
jgi:PhnB protein